jgi:hypothetical protein
VEELDRGLAAHHGGRLVRWRWEIDAHLGFTGRGGRA